VQQIRVQIELDERLRVAFRDLVQGAQDRERM